MSKKKSTPWYNPIDDDYWNGYYAIVTPLFLAFFGLVALIVLAALFNTFVRGM